MKPLNLALALGLVLGADAQATGLIQVPDAAVVKTTVPAPGLPGKALSPLGEVISGSGSDDSDILPKRLDGASQAEYETYFNTLIYFQKQSAMATKAAQIPPVVGVRCLPNKGAFGFERVSELDYKLNCFAGTGKKITHVAEYRMNVEFLPKGCATEAKIHEQFSNPANRNRKSAAEFYNLVRKACIIQAYPANSGNPVVKVTSVSTDFVTKSLADNADLDEYVNGSRVSKAPNAPDYEKAADQKPAKRPGKPAPKDEDEEEEPVPARKKDAACVPGNIFCSKSAD